MPLYRKPGSLSVREMALFWQMVTSEGLAVDVYVYASTLQSLGLEGIGPVGLLKRHRDLLERAASEKVDRSGMEAGLPVHVTSDDIEKASVISQNMDANTASDD
jgi:hypothetical protein